MDTRDIIPPLPDDDIHFDPHEFYTDFGYLKHPATGILVKKLAPYQIESWKLFQKYRRVLEVKSHKVGESRKWLISDFQLAVLPSSNLLSCRGFDQLVIGQTKDLAKEHLLHLRRAILRSSRYSGYLIDKPTEIDEYDSRFFGTTMMRDEKTKTGVIYIRNPDDERQPGRIIALGADNPGAIESWPNVKNVHMSDITATIGDYRESLNVAMTRLANTNGSMIIETIPGATFGPVYEMWKHYNDKEYEPGDFRTYKVVAEQAVSAGVISREFLESERRRLGHLFEQYYGGEFLSVGNAWYDDILFHCEDEEEVVL